MPRRLVWLCWLLAATLAGCASWSKSPEGEPKELPIARMSPDTVVVEVTFVEVPAADDEAYEEIWTEVDEQSLPVELRRRMLANGIRCGHIGSQMPARLREQLNNPDDIADLLAGDARALDNSLAARTERRQLRAGMPAKLVVTKEPREKIHVLLSENGQVAGKTFRQAQCVFRLRGFPTGDSRARLELSPEIHHGEMRQRWVGHEGAMRLDADRERKTFDDLTLETVLSPGQTLIVGSTSEPIGVGGQFFAPSDQGLRTRRCLLIRLAQTQLDDLFAPVPVVAPIVTPGE